MVEGNHISFAPIRTLFSRRLAYHAVRNGVAQAFLEQKCHGQAPPWFTQGLASYLGEEGNVLMNFTYEFRDDREVVWSSARTIQHVHPLIDRENGRIALYNAFLMVWKMVEGWGWDCVRQLTDEMANGIPFADAVKSVYGMDEASLLELLDPSVNGEPTGSDFRPTFN